MSGYITAGAVASLRERLSERDWQIVMMLARVRVATTTQLEQVCGLGLTRRGMQRKLTVLTELRVVARLPRVVGGVRAGSSGHVYALDAAGQRLVGRDRPDRVVRPWTPSAAFLTHMLAVTELYVQLVACERAGQVQLARYVAEPGSWRHFFGRGGGRAVLKPDAYAVLRVDGFEDHWFIEADRATESLPTIARKCSVYRSYWQSGTEQAGTGLFPKVLWLAPTQKRADDIWAMIRRQPVEAWDLFAACVYEEAIPRLLHGAGL